MAENGVVRHASHLDPAAEEFRPVYPTLHQQLLQLPYFYPPDPQPEFFYPLQPPPPPPPPAATLPPSTTPPTRAILLSSVPPEVSESIIRRELEVLGDVRAVEMERVREGIVTVHFYNLRVAHAALDAVRQQHMQHQQRLQLYYSASFLAPNNFSPLHPSYGPPIGLSGCPPPSPPPVPGTIAGRAVWAQFVIPGTNAYPDGNNQGTIVVFNLHPDVSPSTLRNIFQSFGAVKELRETPMKKQQKFVEFYDVRDASRALAEMNGKQIHGRNVLIEFSRPGGYCFRNNHFTSPTTKPRSPPPPLRNRGSFHRHAAERELRLEGERKEKELPVKKSNGSNIGENCCSSTCGVRIITKERKGGKPLKGNDNNNMKEKKFDPKFMIKEEAIIMEDSSGGCRDTRTTVMIKNIPNKYSQKLLLNMLDNHCIHCNEQIASAGEDQPLSSYDFVYLPIDFNNKCNVGYGFVNMTSPEATLRLYKVFHRQHWEVFNSRKICEVTYARVQGLEALQEHFKNSKFACQNDEYLPVVFNPPRDGRQLTAPTPMVLPPITPSPTVHHNHDHGQTSHDDHIDGGDHLSSSSDLHHDENDEGLTSN